MTTGQRLGGGRGLCKVTQRRAIMGGAFPTNPLPFSFWPRSLKVGGKALKLNPGPLKLNRLSL